VKPVRTTSKIVTGGPGFGSRIDSIEFEKDFGEAAPYLRELGARSFYEASPNELRLIAAVVEFIRNHRFNICRKICINIVCDN
jgi:hypothetical protein